MLDVKLTLSSVDWDSCVDAAFPMIIKKLQSSNKQSLPLKILKNSGAELAPLLKKVLNMLSASEKNEFLQWASASYESKAVSAIDGIIKSRGLSDCVSIGGIKACSGPASEQIELHIIGLDIDYASPAVQSLIRDKLSVNLPTGLTGFLGRTAQGVAVKLFASKSISDKICALAENKLRGKGISVRVSGCEITDHVGNSAPAVSSGRQPMGEKLEACIIRTAGEIIRQLGK